MRVEDGRDLIEELSPEGGVKVSLQDDQEDPPMEPLIPEEPVYEEFPRWCDGRVFTAPEALRMGLVDQIGYLDDALAAARELAGCPSAKAVLMRRRKDPARTPYAITPNNRATMGILNVSVPGLERSRLPTFMYIWMMEPSMDADAGRSRFSKSAAI